MKKYVTTSLFIFWVVTVAVMVAGLISYNNNQSTIGSNVGGINQPNNLTGVNSNAATLILSKTELAKHNSGKSCWILISGKIYDVTTYINQHPGGANEILPTCGTDATAAYDTKGRPNGSPHSSNAETLLANYLIGNLNQTITTSPNNPTTPPITNPNPTLPRSRDNDDD